MDRLDKKILRLLQEDLTLAVADIAKKVGLSTTPCWRRIQKFEEEGVVRRRVALLDPVKINAKVTVFVSIRTNTHSIEWLKRFSEVIQEFPEVVEFYRMSGDVDYLLRVVVPDIAAYDAFYKRMIAKIEIRDVSSAFAMEQIKYTTEMPLDYMVLEKESAASELMKAGDSAPLFCPVFGAAQDRRPGLFGAQLLKRLASDAPGGRVFRLHKLLRKRNGGFVQLHRAFADGTQRPADRLPDKIPAVGCVGFDDREEAEKCRVRLLLPVDRCPGHHGEGGAADEFALVGGKLKYEVVPGVTLDKQVRYAIDNVPGIKLRSPFARVFAR